MNKSFVFVSERGVSTIWEWPSYSAYKQYLMTNFCNKCAKIVIFEKHFHRNKLQRSSSRKGKFLGALDATRNEKHNNDDYPSNCDEEKKNRTARHNCFRVGKWLETVHYDQLLLFEKRKTFHSDSSSASSSQRITGSTFCFSTSTFRTNALISSSLRSPLVWRRRGEARVEEVSCRKKGRKKSTCFFDGTLYHLKIASCKTGRKIRFK